MTVDGVDLEDAAGYVGAEHDFPFVFVHGGGVAGPDLEVMQGCQRLMVAAHRENCSFSMIPWNCLLRNLMQFLSPVFILSAGLMSLVRSMTGASSSELWEKR